MARPSSLMRGRPIGNKKITVMDQEVTVAMATLTITASTVVPTIAAFSLFGGCNALAGAIQWPVMKSL